MIPASEWDRALAAGVVQVTRPNARPVRCVVCQRRCGERMARRVWLDGHARGFGCYDCIPRTLWALRMWPPAGAAVRTVAADSA